MARRRCERLAAEAAIAYLKDQSDPLIAIGTEIEELYRRCDALEKANGPHRRDGEFAERISCMTECDELRDRIDPAQGLRYHAQGFFPSGRLAADRDRPLTS